MAELFSGKRRVGSASYTRVRPRATTRMGTWSLLLRKPVRLVSSTADSREKTIRPTTPVPVIFIRFPAMMADAVTTAPIEKSIRPRERLGIIAIMMIAGRTDCRSMTRMDLAVKSLPPVAIPKNRHTTKGKASVLRALIKKSLVLDDINHTCHS